MKVPCFLADGTVIGQKDVTLRILSDGRTILDLGFPVQYNMDTVATFPRTGNLCIDIGGRNHGRNESVYVDLAELMRIVDAAQAQSTPL